MSNKKERAYRKHHKWLNYAAQAVFFLCVFFVTQQFLLRNNLTSKESAPHIQLPTLSDEVITVKYQPEEEESERLTLVYFFAPWCTVCHLSVPNLKWLKKIKGDSLTIVFIALSWQDASEIERFFEEHHELGELQVLLGTQTTAEQWKVHGFPTYYVINQAGQVISRDMGYTSTLGLWIRTTF